MASIQQYVYHMNRHMVDELAARCMDPLYSSLPESIIFTLQEHLVESYEWKVIVQARKSNNTLV